MQPTDQPPVLVKLLAHDLRWSLVQALIVGDLRVQELVALVDQPINLVSYHLKKLRDDSLVKPRRSDADGRDIYYSLDLDRLHDLYFATGAALHIETPGRAYPPLASSHNKHGKNNRSSKRVLFVCTHNSARSQMAEGLLNSMSGGQVKAASAGSRPTKLHPDTIATMDKLGIDIRQQSAKSLEAVAGQAFDTVITLCDKAREEAPILGDSRTTHYIHWSTPDPLETESDTERKKAFARIAQQLQTRIRYFLQTEA